MNQMQDHSQGHQGPQGSGYPRLQRALPGDGFLFLAVSTLKVEWAMTFAGVSYHVNRRNVREIKNFKKEYGL